MYTILSKHQVMILIKWLYPYSDGIWKRLIYVMSNDKMNKTFR